MSPFVESDACAVPFRRLKRLTVTPLGVQKINFKTRFCYVLATQSITEYVCNEKVHTFTVDPFGHYPMILVKIFSHYLSPQLYLLLRGTPIQTTNVPQYYLGFQHTPDPYPRTLANSLSCLSRNSFHLGLWGCLRYATGLWWGFS